MISYNEFIYQVEKIKPSILKEHKKSITLSWIQILGLSFLFVFTLLIPSLFFEKVSNQPSFASDDAYGLFGFIILCFGGWIGFFYSLKFLRKEKREEYSFKSATHLLDTIIIIIGIIGLFYIFSLNEDFINSKGGLSWQQRGLLLLECFLIIFYFKDRTRLAKRDESKKNIPIYKILSILGINQEIDNPDILRIGNDCSFCYQDLTNKFSMFGYNRFGIKVPKDIWYGVVFKIPLSDIQTYDIQTLKKRIKQFILSSLGQDLFFHSEVKEIKQEQTDTNLWLYFITYHGNGVRPINYYLDRYFYYSKKDLLEIYNDGKNLLETFRF